MIDVSVVIPCTDKVEELERAIISIFNQHFSKKIEIILVENNSKDKLVVPLLVSRLASLSNIKIKHYFLKNCDNANWARNYGIEKSTGQYVAYLDADDWWSETYLNECYKIANGNEVALYAGFILDNGKYQKEKKSKDIKAVSAYTFLFGESCGVAQTSSFFLHSNILNTCRWDTNLKRSQDYDFFINVQKKVGWLFNPNLSVYVFWEIGTARSISLEAFKVFYAKHNADMTAFERGSYVCEIMKALSGSDTEGFAYFKNILNQDNAKLTLKDRIMTSHIIICRFSLLIKNIIAHITSIFRKNKR